MKHCRLMTGGLIVLTVLVAALALLPPEPYAFSEAQKKLMARRAAKADALRNLAETIYGVRIDSETTVRDFVTKSDVIRTRLDTLIQGAKEVDYIEHPDGTAEVTVEITVGPVEDILGRRLYYDYETFRATGYGAPPGGSPSTTTTAPAYGDVLKATGYGVEPDDPNMSLAERALMARRAAKLDALRNLTEQVYGVRITSDSYVRDFVTRSDEIRARVSTYIQGARVVSERRMPDGSYESVVEIDTAPLRTILGVR